MFSIQPLMWLNNKELFGPQSYSILLTLNGPNFFRCFSGYKLRCALFVYRLLISRVYAHRKFF